LSSYILAGVQTEADEPIYGLPVSVNYSTSATGYGLVTQTTVIQATLQDFISLGPDSLPLFDVSIGTNRISITALRTFETTSGNDYMEFNWNFALTPAAGLSFDGANLSSSSLFSVPPFTFPVNPQVTFDPTTDSISVDGLVLDGDIGIGIVNNRGVAIIDFITVPEPSTWALLASGIGTMFLFRWKVSATTMMRLTNRCRQRGMAASAVAALWRNKPVPLRARCLVPRA
jgi:hypothetical protein